MKAGVALDVKRMWLGQIFHHNNASKFLLLPLENANCNTRSLPIIITVEHLLLPLETWKSNSYNNKKKQGIQITIVQKRFQMVREL
jgi:hypothetical protein